MGSWPNKILRYKILLICCGLFACKSNTLKEDVSKIIGSKIELHIDSLEVINDWCDITLLDFRPSDYNLIVYYDSTACASCVIGKLSIWKPIISKSIESNGNFRIFYIFSPLQKDIPIIKEMINYQQFDYPIFIDREYIFSRQNKHIANKPLFHIFLMNKENEILLLGNPLSNKKLWDLYMNILSK